MVAAAAAIAVGSYFVGRLLRPPALVDEQEWKYLPVRRFLLFLERSIDRAIKWAVFEPSDDDEP